jgi:cytochrome b561
MASATGYTSTAKILHWLIVALLIAQFIFAWTMPHIGRNTPVTTLISLHFTFGILVLVVAIVRLAWRATRAEPAPLDGIPPWQVQSARIVHWLLYILLFVMLILGWINASWRGMPVVCSVWSCRNWSPRAPSAGVGPVTCTRCSRII